MATRSTGTKRPAVKTKRTRAASKPLPKGAPTIEDLRRIARAIVTATSVDDEKRMLSLYADAVESQEADENPSFGIEAIKRKFQNWKEMTSNASWHARNLWVDGQTVLIEWEGQITMRGGRRIPFREVAIHEIRNGKIVRERFYYDPALLRG
jgi:ketosteroid isomerase-like protein